MTPDEGRQNRLEVLVSSFFFSQFLFFFTYALVIMFLTEALLFLHSKDDAGDRR